MICIYDMYIDVTYMLQRHAASIDNLTNYFPRVHHQESPQGHGATTLTFGFHHILIQ